MRLGAQMAFDEVAETHYRFEHARVVVSLHSDFMFTHPARLRHIRRFTDGRRIRGEEAGMNRLFVAESSPTITGTMADHRLPIGPADIEDLTRELADRLGAKVEKRPRQWPASVESWLDAARQQLESGRGSSVVVPGENQPPVVHALAQLINQLLGNVGKTVFHTATAEAAPLDQSAGLEKLTRDMAAGSVELLIMLGGNPAYNAPADLEFARHLEKVPFAAHLSPYQDETSVRCDWHLAETHFLEGWSDTRAFDGTITIVQPLIMPLYNTRSALEVVDAMLAQPGRSDYDVVRGFWQAQKVWDDFEKQWRRALHDGVVEGSAFPERKVSLKLAAPVPLAEDSPASPAEAGAKGNLELSFAPDPCIWDGRFANNGWLQELAKPVTKLTWDNAVLVSPLLAEQRQLSSGDVVELRINDRRLEAPVLIMPGQAERTVTVHLGFGRTHSGRSGDGTGFDAYRLRTRRNPWFTPGLQLTKSGRTHPFALTQHHHAVEGRDVLFEGTWKEFQEYPDFIRNETREKEPAREETLYYPDEHEYSGYRWGMMIDLTTCVGCNACVIACQAENNIPIVGKAEVMRGREMQWIRVDSYFKGGLENPQVTHQPVPCMQCENAPCELVCPVDATLHDKEGLNLQVYNRCIGTRYCSNNCPYKVRRFNFLQYTDYRTPSLKPMRNPDVTVRWRGVMEKCTYCIQRISEARIKTKKEDRRIRDGEVVTACQQACPAEAIIFGDLSDPKSRVSKLRQHQLSYGMLAELNTRPRTRYLAKLRNPTGEVKA